MSKISEGRKEVLLNGVIVGEYMATGDLEQDAIAARQVLIDKGVYVEISLFDSMRSQARAFANTSAYLYENDLKTPPRKGMSAAPFAVNAAFSIELYLKALGQKHGVSLRGHELVKLYKALPAKALEEIEAMIPKCAANRNLQEKPDFTRYLDELNTAFTDWRYCYEVDKTKPLHIEPTIFVMQVLHEACGLK